MLCISSHCVCLSVRTEKQELPIMLTYGVKYYVPDPAKLREDYSRCVCACVCVCELCNLSDPLAVESMCCNLILPSFLEEHIVMA